MCGDERPINGIREETLKVRVMDLWIRTKEFEIFPVPDAWHEGNTKQMSQPENGGTLCLRVS
jgi:hypothetical protein